MKIILQINKFPSSIIETKIWNKIEPFLNTPNYQIPNARYGHVSMLSPSNKNHLLIYGGRDNQKTFPDLFCLDLGN